MLDYRSPLERLCVKLSAMAKANILPLISGLVSGLLAHMFVITNKLMNADEVTAIYSKGATIDSGRWALESLRYIFPDLSVPWLWGIMTIAFITVAACITLRIFNIKHRFLRALLPALFVSFPSLTGTMCFMFTSNSYGLAFLLAVLAVWVFVKLEKRALAWIISCCFLAFSMGIYQAYVAISASFFVLLMIQKLLEKEDAFKVLRFGLCCFGMLLVSLGLYYGINVLAVEFFNGEILSYAFENEAGVLRRVALAYNAFVRSIFSSYFGFVSAGPSRIAHIIALAVCAVLVINELVKLKDIKKCCLSLLCIALLPLSMNCIFLISSAWIIHSLVLYSFVAVYVFAAILLDRADTVKLCWGRDAVAVCMLLIIICNTFFANKVYLKMHVQYENAFSFYTSVMSGVYGTEGYDETKPLAILGKTDFVPEYEYFDTGDLFGPSTDLVNVYTNTYFIENYIGYSGPVYDGSYHSLSDDPRVVDMPCYPAEGSIACIDDIMVVKFG